MNVKQKLKEVAREFDLKIDFKNRFKYIQLSDREIIIRNFIGSCPDPIYVRYKNNPKNAPVALVKFLKSKDFQREIRHPAGGCVISQKDLKQEAKLAAKIPDSEIRKETIKLFKKLKNKIGTSRRLTLIFVPSGKRANPLRKRDNYLRSYYETLLHEFIHELMEYNNLNIAPKSWRWNEGLVSYITFFALDRHRKYENPPKLGKDEMINIYDIYTHKVALLLKNARTPEERKKIIVNLVRKLR